MKLETWLAFFVASWLISLSPGAGAIKSMSTGMRYGYRKGLYNILGLQMAIVLMIGVVAVGLGAVLATSALAFELVKWAGAAYLIVLGIKQWRSEARPMEAERVHIASPRRLVLEGFLVNASNPKGIVFLLAVLPQFIDPALPQWPQYAICALTLVFTDLVVMSGYTIFASRMLRALHEPHHVRWINRSFGAMFIGAGALIGSFRRSA